MMRILDWNDLKSEDYIDSRTIIEKYDELKNEIEDEEREPTEDEGEFMDAVDDLSTEVSDWDFGAQMIREDCFEDYARQLAEDIGSISGDEQWPFTHIDWEAAATELQMNYSSVSFLGCDYLVRS